MPTIAGVICCELNGKRYKARAWNFSFFVITDEVFNLPLSDAVWGALLAQIPKRGITGSACLL